MSTSATDIITYIGVPLAVLGVLPILYTFFLSILTQRRIRHRLITHGHKPLTTRNNQEGFVLRASPMTSLIEVEMPRYTIAPVERSLDDYWTVTPEVISNMAVTGDHRMSIHLQDLTRGHHGGNGAGVGVGRVESTLSMLEEGRVRGFLRGGSWRTFHWRRLIIGRKLYRIQYEDELREPPAEIEFADLVNFLMDWGAHLDGTGWEKLRSGGLWTPAGTVLLKVGDDIDSDGNCGASGSGADSVRASKGEWVLRTSMPDDTDGVLALCVRWPPGRNFDSVRNVTSLPPGWGRLRRPQIPKLDDDEVAENQKSRTVQKKSLSKSIAELVDADKRFLDSASIRFKLSNGIVTQVHPEVKGKESGFTLELFRLSRFPQGQELFTCAASAVLTLAKSSNAGSLWGFETPSEITSFVRKDSVPCGVLVVLELLAHDKAPHWFSEDGLPNPHEESARQHEARFMARMQAERLEASMPPEQARVHKANRQMEERRQMMDSMSQQLAATRLREQKRLQDALVSPRMGVVATADACLAWLQRNEIVEIESSVLDVAEAVLYLLVAQSQSKEEVAAPTGTAGNAGGTTLQTETMPVLKILEEWSCWATAGGMKREQIELLEAHRSDFCYAACLVAAIYQASSVSTGQGKASVDMLECLKSWRKVRLG